MRPAQSRMGRTDQRIVLSGSQNGWDVLGLFGYGVEVALSLAERSIQGGYRFIPSRRACDHIIGAPEVQINTLGYMRDLSYMLMERSRIVHD